MKNDQDLAAAMKLGMRHLASGVAIVATRDERSSRHGMTVTSVTSLTDQPPSLLVCLNKESETCRALQNVQYFSVNVLAQNQQQVSDNFAFGSEGEARFQYGVWRDHPRYAVPQLQQSLVCFLCCRDQRVEYGNHDIVVANIMEVNVMEEELPPLIYCRNRYQQLTDVE